jgi:hypothetical protein
MVITLQVPQKAGKFLSSCISGGFSEMAQLPEFSKLHPQ